jgi:predicted DNA-binding protein
VIKIQPQEKKEYVLIHVKMEREIYERLWQLVKKRYTIPTKKFYLVVNEALREYIEDHQ